MPTHSLPATRIKTAFTLRHGNEGVFNYEPVLTTSNQLLNFFVSLHFVFITSFPPIFLCVACRDVQFSRSLSFMFACIRYLHVKISIHRWNTIPRKMKRRIERKTCIESTKSDADFFFGWYSVSVHWHFGIVGDWHQQKSTQSIPGNIAVWWIVGWTK